MASPIRAASLESQPGQCLLLLPSQSGHTGSYLVLCWGAHAQRPGGKLLQQGHPLGHASITGLIPVPSDHRAEGGRGHPGEFRGLKYPKNLPGGNSTKGQRRHSDMVGTQLGCPAGHGGW